MDLSIVILNYKSKGFTLNCVKSITEAAWTLPSADQNPLNPPLARGLKGEGALRYEIIVVDNNSNDQIGEILAWQNPDVIFIPSQKNLGMGAGNNLGIKKASGKYIVIMNPDTIAFKDTFVKLYQYMEANPGVGAAGPKQYYPDKSVQDTSFRWFGLFTPIYRRVPLGNPGFVKNDLDRFLMKDYNKEDAIEVDWLMGSFLFCRAKALEQAGMFDENFFMYFEDTDLCKRLWQRDWKVVYYPQAEIIHNHARQSATEPWYKFFVSRASRTHIASWIKYVMKWGTK